MSKSSALSTFISQLLRTILAAIFVVLCSRWMGPEGRGELGLVLFWSGLMMVASDYVGGSNLANAIQRFGLHKLLPIAVCWGIFSVLCGCVCLFVSGAELKMVLMSAAISFPLVLLTIQYNMQQGLAKIQLRNRLQLLIEILKLVFLYYFVQFRETGTMGVGSAIASIFWAMMIALLISSWSMREEIKDAFAHALKPPKALFTDGFWSQNGHLAQFLAYRLSLYTLTYLLGSTVAAGVYSNALLIADAVWIFANSFGTIAHVRILRSNNENFKADITLRYAFFVFVGTVLACLLLAILPSGIFVWVFGKGFETLKDTSLLFIPGILAVAASSLFSHYLHAVNRFKALFFANMCGLILQTAMGFWLIPRWGVYGACLAADVGFILTFLLVYGFFKSQNPHARLKGKIRFRLLLKVSMRIVKGRSASL
jgi:O-antigen/teichoic acid export membrane protein